MTGLLLVALIVSQVTNFLLFRWANEATDTAQEFMDKYAALLSERVPGEEAST